MTEPKHPLQPLHIAPDGVLRYKKNHIVAKLLELATANKFGLNEIVVQVMDGTFPSEDYRQLMMLIGYSHSGVPDMPDDLWASALAAYETGKTETEARLEYCEGELRLLKRALQKPMARLYGKHPDDFDVGDVEDVEIGDEEE